MAEPGRVDRASLAVNMGLIRSRLPVLPEIGLPGLESLDAEAHQQLRLLGRGRLGCMVVVVRFSVLDLPEGGAPPPGLANAVLRHAASVLRDSIRASDLLLARTPDLLVVLVPGGEPLAGRGVLARLSSLLARHRDTILGVNLDIIPAYGAAFRASTPIGGWDLNALVNEAKSRATVAGPSLPR